MDDIFTRRQWMYNQRVAGRSHNNETFMVGVRHFIDSAIGRGHLYEGDLMRCPCSKCKNKKFVSTGLVESHLYTRGFVRSYYNWILHGEEMEDTMYTNPIGKTPEGNAPHEFPAVENRAELEEGPDTFGNNYFQNMIRDVASSSRAEPETLLGVDIPNEAAMNFYNLMNSSKEPAFEGCTTETELSISMKFLQTKNDYGIAEAGYDSICDITRNLLDRESRVPTSFRQTKRFLTDLGMPVTRIDICKRGCMIYYQEDEHLTECRVCGDPRYKAPRRNESSSSYQRNARAQMFYLPIIPRLQRIFMIESTACHMSWHSTRDTEDKVMVHPADGQSWKHFNNCYPEFAADPRNVRLGLCSDGFTPFGNSSRPYSCWPVMLTPYNMPPWMCMKTRFLWLTILIPGPNSPKKGIDIYLKPLIDDLRMLWTEGVNTYDAHAKRNFNLRAALMWTISDFPAYGMLSGWSTAGRLGCPHCMEDTKAFWLTHGRKHSYFDCHRRFLPDDHPYRHNQNNFTKGRCETDPPIYTRSGHEVYQRVCNMKYVWEQGPKEKIPGFGGQHNWTKKSIFWLLPYWPNVMLRHNLDVMHIEKNVFENLFNTVMNVKGKSKDNGIRCRADVGEVCDRSEIEIIRHGRSVYAPCATYQLTIEDQIRVLEWIKSLQFPDGYGARLGRHVDMEKRKLVGYKSHDAHVFLERLMAIAFRGMLRPAVWEAIAEIATFFKDICASSLDVERMLHWRHNIVVTLCKLEIFFPPSFFDSMEHLPIHVAEEMLLGGPVHYRWMYPFERFIFRLKKTAKNKSEIEASIVNAYVQQEISFLGSEYLGPEFKTKTRLRKRNEVFPNPSEFPPTSIFNHPGAGGKVVGKRSLSEKEYAYATHYILSNTPELEDYYQIYETELQSMYPEIEGDALFDTKVAHFAQWLEDHIKGLRGTHRVAPWLYEAAMGFHWRVSCIETFKVNNYKFHTEQDGQGRATVNCHVHVKGGDGQHYYGVIEEMFHVCSRRNGVLKVVLFKCRWFDPAYTRSYVAHGITEINTRRLYPRYDPFILAQQAEQVYYTPFPGMSVNTRQGWVAVCSVRPTNAIDMRLEDLPFQADIEDETDMPVVHAVSNIDNVSAPGFNVYSSDEDDPNEDDAEEDMQAEWSSELSDTVDSD